jgi:hypothetical protein
MNWADKIHDGARAAIDKQSGSLIQRLRARLSASIACYPLTILLGVLLLLGFAYLLGAYTGQRANQWGDKLDTSSQIGRYQLGTWEKWPTRLDTATGRMEVWLPNAGWRPFPANVGKFKSGQ